jgi:hypothetical protein
MIEQAVLVAFASWRLASLIAVEEGPGGIFERARRFIGVPKEGEIRGLLPVLITCIWCVSLWTAALLWGVWEYWRPEPVIVLAAAAGAIVVERWVRDG